MIEILILYTLLKVVHSYYGIKKNIDALFAPFISISYGSIHPALKKLETQECISIEKQMSKGGQRRSSYKITSKGKARLQQLMIEDLPENPQSAKQISDIKLMIIDTVSEDNKIEIIKNIIRFHELQIAKTKSVIESNNHTKAGKSHLLAHIHNLREFINYLRNNYE